MLPTNERDDSGVLPLRVYDELVHSGGIGGQAGQGKAVATRHLRYDKNNKNLFLSMAKIKRRPNPTRFL